MDSAWQPNGGFQAEHAPLKNDPSLLFRASSEQLVPSSEMELLPGPWNPSPNDPLPSGCDSSSCTYCQGMASRQSSHSTKSVCWLRRKRSENDIAGMSSPGNVPAVANVTSHPFPQKASPDALRVPDVDLNKPRSESMWDHALMEPEEAFQAVSLKLSTNRCSISQPWSWDPSYHARPLPVPSTLLEVAQFAAPRPRHQGCPTPHGVAGDIVCGMEFEEHGWLLATAGVSKQVRVYSLASLLASNDYESISSTSQQYQYPTVVHRLASKLSSLAWNPDQPGVVTVGDYDGVVVQLDLESGHLVAEQDEHCGRRVWSVSHSHLRPHVAASGSEDGTAALWAGAGLQQVAGRVSPGGKASITGVHLSPYDENALAVACADAHAYVYDLRQLSAPVVTLHGHSRPVSYVKFLDRSTLVTAAIDATLAAWDLSSPRSELSSSSSAGCSIGRVLTTPQKVFKGHSNCKNFVGLAVRPEDQLVACGSERSEVFTYSMSWDMPVTSYDFSAASTLEGTHCTCHTAAGVFCSAVSWQPAGAAPGCGPLLAAAASDGGVNILGLRRLAEE